MQVTVRYFLVHANRVIHERTKIFDFWWVPLYTVWLQYGVLCPRINNEPGFIYLRSQYGLCRSWWWGFSIFLSPSTETVGSLPQKGDGTLLLFPPQFCHHTLQAVQAKQNLWNKMNVVLRSIQTSFHFNP